MQRITARLVKKFDAVLGEGAFWNHHTGELYWVDIESKYLHILDPAGSAGCSWSMPSRIGTVVPAAHNKAIVALEDGVYRMDLISGDLEQFAAIEADQPGIRLNDGKCDLRGRLWVGSMSIAEEPGAGSLYRVDPDGTVTRHLRGVSISNGIVWTADGRTMYYIDTPTSEVRAYDFEPEAGTITNERVAVPIDPSLGYPDGMTIDAEDKIWVAMWQGSAVLRFDPETGELLTRVKVPAYKITSCAFGGPRLDTLYITTASINMTPEQHERYPDAGSIFAVRPGVKGRELPFFGAG